MGKYVKQTRQDISFSGLYVYDIGLVLIIRNLMECILVKGQGGKCKKLILKGRGSEL